MKFKVGDRVTAYQNHFVYSRFNGKIGVITKDLGVYVEITYHQGVAYYPHRDVSFAKNEIVNQIIKDLL